MDPSTQLTRQLLVPGEQAEALEDGEGGAVEAGPASDEGSVGVGEWVAEVVVGQLGLVDGLVGEAEAGIVRFVLVVLGVV